MTAQAVLSVTLPVLPVLAGFGDVICISDASGQAAHVRMVVPYSVQITDGACSKSDAVALKFS